MFGNKKNIINNSIAPFLSSRMSGKDTAPICSVAYIEDGSTGFSYSLLEEDVVLGTLNEQKVFAHHFKVSSGSEDLIDRLRREMQSMLIENAYLRRKLKTSREKLGVSKNVSKRLYEKLYQQSTELERQLYENNIDSQKK